MSNPVFSIKVAVQNAAHSKAIQEYLFANGCRWNYKGHEIKHEDKAFLFVDERGNIGWDNSVAFFNRTTDYKEVIFNGINKPVVVSVEPKERPKTVLFGKTYFTDELEARLAGLEVASGRS